MKIWRLILCLFLSFRFLSAFAEKSHLTCSSSGTDIYFINGVNVDEIEFKNFRLSVVDLGLMGDKGNYDNKLDLNIIPIHNSSEGIKKDLAEALYQYLENVPKVESPILGVKAAKLIYYILSTNSGKLRQICNQEISEDQRYVCDEMMRIKAEKMSSQLNQDLGKFRSLIATSIKHNRKIVLVGHSQGTLFADDLRSFIRRYYPAHDQYTSSLLIAAIKKSNNARTAYFNYTKDGVLEQLMSAFITVPERKFAIGTTCNPESTNPTDGFTFKASNHSFECYSGNFTVEGPQFLLSGNHQFTARDYLLDLLKKSVSELGNNDFSCCNKMKGKVWQGSGGFISDGVFIIGDNLRLDSASRVCASGILDSTQGEIKLVNSELKGILNLKGKMEFFDTKSSDWSQLTIDLSSQINLSQIRDSNFKGKFEAKRLGNVIDSTLSGNVFIDAPLGIFESEISGEFDVRYKNPRTIDVPFSHSVGKLKTINEKKIKVKADIFNVEASDISQLNIDATKVEIKDSVILGHVKYDNFSIGDSHRLEIKNSIIENELFMECDASGVINVLDATIEGERLDGSCPSTLKGNMDFNSASFIGKGSSFVGLINGAFHIDKFSVAQGNYSGNITISDARVIANPGTTINNATIVYNRPPSDMPRFDIISRSNTSNLSITGSGNVRINANIGDNVTFVVPDGESVYAGPVGGAGACLVSIPSGTSVVGSYSLVCAK